MSEYGITYTLTTPAGTLTFNPTPSNTDGLYLSDIQGMDAGVRGAAVPLAQRDGAYVFDSYRDAAYPTLTGFTRASTLAARTTLIDNLRAITDSLRFADGTLSWNPSGYPGIDGTRSLTVRLIGAVQIGNDGGVMKSFQLQLVAAYPFARNRSTAVAFTPLTIGGGALSFPFSFPFTFGDVNLGTVTVTPAGTVATYPTFTIIGPIAAPIVSNLTTGKKLSLPGLTVQTADQLVIDMLNQLIYVNSKTNSKMGFLDPVLSDFWTLSAGVANQVLVSGAGVSGGVQLLWQPTWA
jgi:hypothetical protein